MKNRISRRIAAPSTSAFVSQSGKIPFPSIGEFSFSSLVPLASIPSFQKLALSACCLVVMMCVMACIRDNSDEENKDYDSRPSVRFYKSKYFNTMDTVVVAACLAIVPVLSFLESADPAYIENQIKASIANYRPNLKAPKTPTNRNWPQWVNGTISRILGLLNSCPSSRAGLLKFGLPAGAASSLRVETIIERIPLPKEVKPNYVRVIMELRTAFGIIDVTRKQVSTQPIVFNETPMDSFSASAKTAGISYLEYQVFVQEYPIQSGILRGIPMSRALEPNSAPPQDAPTVRTVDKDDILTFLTPLEVAVYQSAARLGNKSKLIELNKLVEKRKAENNVPGAPVSTSSSSSLTDGIDFTPKADTSSST